MDGWTRGQASTVHTALRPQCFTPVSSFPSWKPEDSVSPACSELGVGVLLFSCPAYLRARHCTPTPTFSPAPAPCLVPAARAAGPGRHALGTPPRCSRPGLLPCWKVLLLCCSSLRTLATLCGNCQLSYLPQPPPSHPAAEATRWVGKELVAVPAPQGLSVSVC